MCSYLQRDPYVSRSTQQIIIELERLLDQMPPTQTASSLPANHDISLLIRQILVTASQAADREETMLAFSQKVVQLLYKAPTQLGREVYAALLDRLCEASAQVSKEAIEWLVYAEDEVSVHCCAGDLGGNDVLQRKFNVPVTALLLKSNLVPIAEQDAQLAKLIMRDLKPSAINFTASLIRDCLLGSAPYASRQHFRHSLEALGQAVQLRKGTDM
jgi:CCR4-NOT transcription complex subunit 1